MAKIDDQIAALTTALTGIGAAVDTMTPEVTKISGETSSLLQKITDLQNNPPSGITPEQSAAIDSMVTQAQGIQTSFTNVAASIKAVDDLVPDATPAP